MEIINPDAQRYAEDHTTAESPLLAKINRDTHAKVLQPNMLSGHLQGRLLSMISHMIRPDIVLEIGTFTGYSAICLSEGLSPGGKLITIDKNEELESRVREYFEEAGLTSRVQYMIGNALSLIPTIDETFDIVFIDADKSNYGKYFDLVIDKLRVGGVIIVDNVLRKGKVLSEKMEREGVVMDAFNKKIRSDSRVEEVLLPIRDGILIIRKLSLQNF
ncbi:O-methyltransferase [Chryseolinea sp. T2]|uniref:O-methyltransferase n=1 Tax=Chryseolinea sp. T2 TaxID=3129255 RepID=UPI003077BE45